MLDRNKRHPKGTCLLCSSPLEKMVIGSLALCAIALIFSLVKFFIVDYAPNAATPRSIMLWSFQAIADNNYATLESYCSRKHPIYSLHKIADEWRNAMDIGGGYRKLILLRSQYFNNDHAAEQAFQVIYENDPVWAVKYIAYLRWERKSWRITYLPGPGDWKPALPLDPDFH